MTVAGITIGTSNEPSAGQPLSGIVVLDFTRFLPGPLATQLLADLGADVIKIEGYPDGDFSRGMEPFIGYSSLNRNKQSIHVDFGVPEGRDVLARLVEHADALVEVSRPGSMARYKLDYDSVRAFNESIVYCSVSAYGQHGSYSAIPSHGYNMDALAGLLDVQTMPDGRPFIGPSGHLMPSSLLAGHAAALGIVSAILRRKASGAGAFIDASVWDCGVSGDPITSAGELSSVPMANGFASPATPKYAPYRTSDGRYLMVCVIEHKYWTEFCRAVGRPDLVDRFGDGHDDDLGAGDPQVYDELAAVVAGRTLAEWEAVIAPLGIPVTPVHSRAEALASDHAAERNIVIDVVEGSGRTYRVAGPSLVIDGQRGSYRSPPPSLGQHTDEILRAVGFTDGDIEVLRRCDAVR